MLRFFKFLTGIALLPAVVAVSITFLALADGTPDRQPLAVTTQWFIGGFAIWVVLFFALPPPVKAYILGHELTHALWGLLMGARVSKLRVSSKGGSVTLTKSNFLITLAPYFFPFYSILALGLYLLLSLWLDMSVYLPFWYAVFGLTWAFHLTFTASMIGSHQPDIREHGRLFSYAVIYVINLMTAAFLIALLARTDIRALPALWWRDIAKAYLACWDWISPFVTSAIQSVSSLF